MKKFKLSSPWVSYYNKLVALFGDDPDIKINYNEDENVVTLYVEGTDKAEAIDALLPEEKVFGNVTLKITVVPANAPKTKIDIYRKAFEGNPAYSYAVTVAGISSNDFNFVVFKNKVVQYWNDNLGDINGNESTLYQNIANDVFEDKDGIYFCTDTEKNLGVPECDD